MYYTDITNEELQYFHNRPVHNFTAKLTDVLSSDLFQIEEIITNSIYKIYPLFYTNEITSSNSNDRILDNKVIICQKLEDETYLTFKSNDGEIIDFTDYGTYYNIGDSLTTAQFNAYVSLLRQFTTHNENINIKDTVNGVYGNYEFDITGATLIDTGLVITDETISAEPKVKLTQNVFSNSNYILKLDVIHYTGANILDDTTSDYKVVDTLEIELIPDEWVNIPVETLQQDYIISLNATVDIDHKKPIIYIPDYELTLTSDKDIIQTDETANLTATLTLDGEPLTGETVNFKVYKASDQSLVETLTGTTDSQGIATVSYVGKGAGSLNIKAECMNLTKTYAVWDTLTYSVDCDFSNIVVDNPNNINVTKTTTDNITRVDCTYAGTCNYGYFDSTLLTGDFEATLRVQNHNPPNSCYITLFNKWNLRCVANLLVSDMRDILVRRENGVIEMKQKLPSSSSYTTLNTTKYGNFSTEDCFIGIIMFANTNMTKSFSITDLKAYRI